MTQGTKSLLFGVHQIFLHPIFVFLGWWRVYGFPTDPRLWVAFIVHDLGYFGKPNMDGPEGETHPLLGATIMADLFDNHPCGRDNCTDGKLFTGWEKVIIEGRGARQHVFEGVQPRFEVCPCKPNRDYWYRFTLYHSRFYSKAAGAQYSKLCVADKMAIAMIPRWLYLLLANLSGEINEYMHAEHARSPLADKSGSRLAQQWRWLTSLQLYIVSWVEHHKDLKEDNWTSKAPITF